METVQARLSTEVSSVRWRRARLAMPPVVVWLPAVLVTMAVLLPVAYLLVRATGAGGDLWVLLFRASTVGVLLRTLLLVATVTGGAIAIALPLAWLTTRTALPLRRAWVVLTVLPLVIPSYVAGFVVVVALGPKGLLQQILQPLGVERLPEIYGFPGAMFTLTLISYPYVLLTARAALERLDPSLEENSRALGHGAWGTFRGVSLPLLRPAIAAGGLLVALYTLSDFGAVSLLRYQTFTWTIYLQYESAFDRSMAAALSLVLVIVAVAILAMDASARGKGRYYRSSPGAARPYSAMRLGWWRWPALAFCAAVVLLAVALPMSVLGYWLARGLAAGETFHFLWAPAANSLYVSALAAVVTVAAALPIAILSVRYRGWLGVLLERAAYVGFALPGIVIALSLVFFSIQVATPLYQTVALLIFAYSVLFLSSAVGGARTALLQVSPRVEEAARLLGRKPRQVLVSITLPLIRPGLLAGAALVFLLTMKELPATLILSPIGFKTLATSIWSAASEALFAQAAAGALLLMAATAVPLALIMTREWRWGR